MLKTIVCGGCLHSALANPARLVEGSDSAANYVIVAIGLPGTSSLRTRPQGVDGGPAAAMTLKPLPGGNALA